MKGVGIHLVSQEDQMLNSHNVKTQGKDIGEVQH